MMTKKFGGFSPYMLAIILPLVLLGIVLGSFFDLSITKALYVGDNFWSLFVEYCGPIPTMAVIGSSGVFLFLHFRESKTKHPTFWAWFFLILAVCVTGSLWGFDTLHRHLTGAYWWFVIGIPCLSLMEVPMYFLLRKGNHEDYLRKGVVIIIAALLVLTLTFGIKLLVVRPRYMFLYQWGRVDLYRDWFDFTQDKSAFVNLPGYESYALQSWPSGHSSFASMMILAVIYPSCFEKTKGKEIWFFAFGMAYAFLVMLARILDGHHFLSDTCFGALFGFLPCALSLWIAYSGKRKPPTSQTASS